MFPSQKMPCLLTFLQGFELISNEDLNTFRCELVRMVRGLFGPFLFSSSSSSSLSSVSFSSTLVIIFSAFSGL